MVLGVLLELQLNTKLTYHLTGTQTHSNKVRAIVVKNCFNFNLLSLDCRVGQPQVNEEFLPDNYLQWISNADSCKENKH